MQCILSHLDVLRMCEVPRLEDWLVVWVGRSKAAQPGQDPKITKPRYLILPLDLGLSSMGMTDQVSR